MEVECVDQRSSRRNEGFNEEDTQGTESIFVMVGE